ncbi:MAG: septation protein A [Gammaproteobacteria bacterium]
MKFLYDFFPVLLFFIVYKFYGEIPAGVIQTFAALPLLTLTPGEPTHAIYLATAVAILASVVQVSLYWLRVGRFEKTHLISLALITIFGGATLALQDPLFIKWKPTILNWLFALAFLGSQFVGDKTLVERMMAHAVTVPAAIWRRVNLGWVSFFVIAGLANIYVAYNFSEEIWVDFKLFGLMGLTLAFVFGQALYLSRYMASAGGET